MNVVQNFPKNSTEKRVSELGHLLSFLVLSLSLMLKNPGVLEKEHLLHSDLSRDKTNYCLTSTIFGEVIPKFALLL